MYESFFKRGSDLLLEIVVQLYFILHALWLIRQLKSGEKEHKEKRTGAQGLARIILAKRFFHQRFHHSARYSVVEPFFAMAWIAAHLLVMSCPPFFIMAPSAFV
jgi:hypothetical protein